MTDLSRFRAVDPATHASALREIEHGRKDSHWMWFVFPQLRGLGRSATALHYGLEPEEAARKLAGFNAWAESLRPFIPATGGERPAEGHDARN